MIVHATTESQKSPTPPRNSSEGRFARGPEVNKERAMVLDLKRIGAIILRSAGVLVLMGCPRVGFAQGTTRLTVMMPMRWSRIGTTGSI